MFWNRANDKITQQNKFCICLNLYYTTCKSTWGITGEFIDRLVTSRHIQGHTCGHWHLWGRLPQGPQPELPAPAPPPADSSSLCAVLCMQTYTSKTKWKLSVCLCEWLIYIAKSHCIFSINTLICVCVWYITHAFHTTSLSKHAVGTSIRPQPEAPALHHPASLKQR